MASEENETDVDGAEEVQPETVDTTADNVTKMREVKALAKEWDEEDRRQKQKVSRSNVVPGANPSSEELSIPRKGLRYHQRHTETTENAISPPKTKRGLQHLQKQNIDPLETRSRIGIDHNEEESIHVGPVLVADGVQGNESASDMVHRAHDTESPPDHSSEYANMAGVEIAEASLVIDELNTNDIQLAEVVSPEPPRWRWIPKTTGAKLLCFGLAALATVIIVVGIQQSTTDRGSDTETNEIEGQFSSSAVPDINAPTAKPSSNSPSATPLVPPISIPAVTPALTPASIQNETASSSPDPSSTPSSPPSLSPSSSPSPLPSFPPSSTPTTRPTSAPTDVSFVPEYTFQTIANNPFSPQAQGQEWVLQHPDFSSFPLWRKQQLLGLATLYYATGGGSTWDVADEYLNAALHECFWNFPLRLTEPNCSVDGKYRNLKWSGLELVKSIPPEFSLLTSLDHLAIYGDQLLGVIPTHVGKLRNLTYLAIAGNQLTGTLPTELGSLTALTLLSWGDNTKTDGTIPSELGCLTMLTALFLGDNALTGTVPTQLYKLSELRDIWLGDTLTGSISTNIGVLSKLTSFVGDSNALTGSIPSELGRATELQSLRLSRNQLTGSLPAELGSLTALTSLSLDGNADLTGSIPTFLEQMTNMSYLFLSGTQLTGSIPSVVCSFDNLARLTISCSTVSCSCAACECR